MDNDDYIYEDDFDEIDSGSYSQNQRKNSNDSFQRGKEIGQNVTEKLKDGSLKEDYEKVKEGIEDLKSGDIKEGIENLKDGADLLHKKNKVEQVGHDIKNTGKTMQKAGDAAEKAGQGIKKASEAGDKLNKATEKGAELAKKGGEGLKNLGKAEEAGSNVVKGGAAALGTVSSAGQAASGAADATIVGAPVGLAGHITSLAGNIAGKFGEGVGTAGQISGKTKQAAGQAQQAAAQGVESGSKLGQAGSKLGKKFGDDLEKAGQKAKDAGKKVEDVGNKIEKTGKDLNNLIKPITATVDILKKTPKIFIIMVIAGFFISITLLYNNSVAHISESIDNFGNYKNGAKELVNGLFSTIVEKREQYYKEEFMEEVQNWYNKSNGKIDFPLVFSILFYADNNSNTQYDFTQISNDDGTPDTSDMDPTYTKGLIKRLNKLCKNMMNGNSLVKEEDYKKFLREKYVSKQPEFEQYYKNLDTTEAQERMINYIIETMFEQRNWYVSVYGDILKQNVEKYEDACYGAIDDDLVKDLALPIDVPNGFKFEFDENTSYGYVNTKIHNGVDLTSDNSGVSYGSDIHSIADGEIENFGQLLEKKNTNEENISQPTDATEENDSYIGSWVKIHHKIMLDGKQFEFYSVYKNLSSLANFKKGDKVSKSDIIGKVGKTSSGKELLYFEFRNESNVAIDPTNLFVECIEKVEEESLLYGDTTEEKIWNYFVGSGYNKFQTAAMLGNIVHESGFRTDNVEDCATSINESTFVSGVDNGSIPKNQFLLWVGNGCEKTYPGNTTYAAGGYGFGLSQWTATNRKDKLYERAKSSSKSIADLGIQVSFLKEELDASWLYPSHESTWKNVSSESGIGAAAEAYCHGFEIAGGCSGRAADANNYYNQYKDLEIVRSSTPESSSNSSIVAEAIKYVGNPYVWGGWSLTNGCDCSHFVALVLQKLGYDVVYQTTYQWTQGTEIPLGDARPGDVFVTSQHMGFIGENGLLIEAKGEQYGITYDRDWSQYKATHSDVRVFRF